MPSEFLTPRRLTSATDAYDQEQAAVGQMNQQAASQDLIGQEQASEKEFANQLKEQAQRAQTAQRQQVTAQRQQESAHKELLGRQKKAGIKTQFNAGGEEEIVAHPDGQPVYDHGFQGDLTPTPEGDHVVKYRTPRGQVFNVPTKAIRSTQDEAGAPQYEFDVPKEDGTKETIRQPVGSKPLFAIDPKTGMRYTGAADPETGSIGQTPIGYDPTARNKAVIEQTKLQSSQQAEERKFKADEIRLAQNVKETNLAPLKTQLTAAKADAKKLAKDKIQYRNDPEKGLVKVVDYGAGPQDVPVPISDPAAISQAQSWLDKKAAIEKALADVRAAHDPLDAEVQTMQQKRDQLAIEHNAADHNAQVQLKRMEMAHKAGIPVYQPDWQKRLDAAQIDPRVTGINTQADLDETGAGTVLAEDARNVRLPETTKLVSRALTTAINAPQGMTPYSMGDSLENPQAIKPQTTPQERMQNPEISLANKLSEGIALTSDNVAPKDADVKELAKQTIGITDPEKWQVTPVEGAFKDRGFHTLSHEGKEIGEIDTQQHRLILNPPDSAGMDAQQTRLLNTSKDGMPVYYASATPPLATPAVRDLFRQGITLAQSTPDQAEAETKLAAAKLAPSDIRQRVMEGQLSVQDGRTLNETLHGVKDIDTSKGAVQQGFQKWLTNPVTGTINAAQFKNGDDKAKQEVINRYFDQVSDTANDNIVRGSRQTLADTRQEMLKPFAGPDFLWSGMGAGSMAKQTVVQMVPLLARGLYDFSGASTVAGWAGLGTEADRLSGEQAANENKRRTGFINRMWMNKGAKASLEDIKTWANQANPGDEVPADLADRIKSVYRDEFHRLDPAAAKDLDPSGTAFDVNKDPTLKALVQRYLITSDPNTWSSLHSVLASDAKDRVTQEAVMKYNDRPIVTTAEEVVKRGKGIDLDLSPVKAAEVMSLGKALETAEDPKKAANIITRAAGMLKLTPQNASLALGILTRTENEDPNSVSSLMRSGWGASRNEAAIELLSTGVELGVGAFLAPATGGASLAAGAASKGARMGVKTALRSAYRGTIGAALNAGIERSATFASAVTRMNAGRRALGTAFGKAGEAYARAGIIKPTFGAPLTTLQKGRNLAVAAAKAAPVIAIPEALEEMVGNTGDTDPTLESMGKAAAGGAFGSLVLSPIFTAYGYSRQGFAANRAAKDFTSEKIKWADELNSRLSGKPGFTPYTAADYDTVAAISGNPAQMQAMDEHTAAVSELHAATAEHTQNVIDYQDAAAGNAVPEIPASPRLLTAQANAERTAANLEGTTSQAFSATDELRALPEAERPLYTGVAKAVSEAQDYTEAEAKALIGLGGQSAVAFLQAQTLPADVAGPRQVATLPGAPTVQQTGTGHYRLPPGVHIQVPQQAINALQQRAPSLTGLIGGTRQVSAPVQNGSKAPNTAESTGSVTPQPQPPPAPPLARNPALASVSDEVLAQRHAQAVKLASEPGHSDSATWAKDASVMAQEIEARKAPPTAQPPVNSGITPTLETRLEQHGTTVSYTPEEQAEVNQKWGKASPFNTPQTFVQGGKGTAKTMPKGSVMDETPITEDEVLSTVQSVVDFEARKRNNLVGRLLVVTSFYQSYDGGADYNIANDTVRVNPLRLARSIWNDRSAAPTRAEIARAAELVIDHEVVHAAQMQAAKDTFDAANPTAKAKTNHATFMAWVADHYGKMWREDLKDVHEATINTYGSILEGRQDWHKAFEALRMIVQDRVAGSTSEAAIVLSDHIRKHLEAALAVLKRWYADVMAGVTDKPAIKAEIEAIEALLKDPVKNNSPSKEPAQATSTGAIVSTTGTSSESPVKGSTETVATADGNTSTTNENASRLNFNVPLSKRGQVREAKFPDPESLAAFQFKQDADTAANARATPEEKAAAKQRGIELMAAMMQDSPITRPELEKKLLDYHTAVVEQADATSPFDTFAPPPFHAYAKIEAKSEVLPAPEGGDIISELKREGVSRIGPPTAEVEWDWYNELARDAAASKLSNREAQKLARAGDITDPKARLAWINANVVSTTGGRSIDEASEDVTGSGEELGRAILAALDARQQTAGQPGATTDESARIAQEKEGQASFDTFASGVAGIPTTAGDLSRTVDTGWEINIGGEWMGVVETDPIDEKVTLESPRFGPVQISGEQIVNITGEPEPPLNGASHTPITHIMPDGYVLTREGIQTIGSAPTRAYHGTPHKVDNFSTDKIGTGEGAQAYGWGLYFAGNKSVAQQYQKGLTERDFISKIREEFSEHDDQETALEVIHGLNLSEGQRALIDVLAKEDWWGFDYPHQAVQAAIREPENFDPSPELLAALEKFGNLYTVELLPDEEEFLDWDKPLSEQSDKVKSSLIPIIDRTANSFPALRGNTSMFGAGIYQAYAQHRGGNFQAASEALASAGIPGIRYLDGNSRKEGKGTSNYVLFDENLVRIIAENGKPVESLASAPSRYQSPTGMLAATQAQMQGEQGEKPAGLNSMFNPKPRIPATGERSLFEMPKTASPAITPRSILDAYRSATVGQSSAMMPIRSVFEKAKESQPSLTIEDFLAGIKAMDDGRALFGLADNMAGYNAAKPFVHGPAGVEMAFQPEMALSSAILHNLDKVKAVRPLLPNEREAYDKAKAMVEPPASQESLASAPSRIDLADAISAIESNAEDPNDTDYWPENLAQELADSPMQQAVENADFAAFYDAMPENQRTKQRQEWYEQSKQLDVVNDRLLKAYRVINKDPQKVFAPEEWADLQTKPEAEREGRIIRRVNERAMQQLTIPERKIYDDTDLSDAEAFVESDEAKDMAIAPFLPQVKDRVKSTIAQIEATGRYKWNAKTKTFDELDEPQVLYSAPSRVTPAQDAEYMASVESGDVAKQQAMVDAAAKAAGYLTEGWHGSPYGPIEIFDPSKSPNSYEGQELDSHGDYSSVVRGWFSTSRKVGESYLAHGYGEKVSPKTKEIPWEDSNADLPEGTELHGWWRPQIGPSKGHGWKHRALTADEIAANKLPAEMLTPSGRLRKGSQLQATFPSGAETGGYALDGLHDNPQAALARVRDFYNAPLPAREKSHLHRVWLKVKNPKVEDFQGRKFKRMGVRAENALREGHDAFIAKNVRDPGASPDRVPVADSIGVFDSSQIKSADPITRDAEGNVILLSRRFNPESDSILYSAPSESASPQATPDNSAQVREILESMPKVWRDVLQDFNEGKSIDDIAKARLYTVPQTTHILTQAQGRFAYLQGQLPTKPKVAPVPGGDPLFKGGRADLAYSGIPAFAAVDQNRGTPEEVTHTEMQDAATRMFAVDPVAAEKLVTRWMDGGGMAFNTDDMPDGIKAIVAEAHARKASMALMTAAAQIFTVENAFAGGSSAKSARLIDLYRNSREEIGRALSQGRDVFETLAERNAWYLQNVLLVPPPSIRAEMKKNPGNKDKILEKWAARADQIKKEMLADGIDLDATFRQMARERELAAATIPEAAKQPLAIAPKSVRQAVKAIYEGGSWQDAMNASGLDFKSFQKAYNGFRGGLRGILSRAAAAVRDTLGSAPTDSESVLGLPECTDDVVLSHAPVQNKATQALAIQRNRKMVQGELDLTNPLSANKARRAMEARKSTQFDKLSEFWRASILSGPQTGIVNVVSGLSYGTYEATFKKFSAAALADIARIFGMKPDAPSLRDLPSMISAFVPSIQAAGRDMVKAWNTEDGIFDSFALNRTGENGELWKDGHTSSLKGWVRKIMHAISFRHMGAADEFVKSFFTRIEVAAQARQIARNEGLEGLKMANRISELMAPGSLAWERSLANAKRITFQNQEVGNVKLESPLQPGHAAIDSIDHLAYFIQKAKTGDYGKLLKAISHVVFPFVATPANILKGGITMSPLGSALAIIDATRALQRMKQGNVEEAKRIYNAARALDDFTNQVVCWGFILGLSSLVKPGDDDEPPTITGTFGSGESTPGERELAYRAAPPQSIRLWGKWYSYKRLDPWASWLAPTIDSIREFQLGKSLDEAIPNVVGNMLKAVKEKSYFQGISEIVNAANDPARFGQRWALGITTGFMPNLIKQSLKASDEAIRDSHLPKDMGFVVQLGRRLGFGMLPHPDSPLALMPAIDVFGRPVTKSTGSGSPVTDTLIRLLSPVEIRDAGGVDPADLMLMHYNMMHDKPFGLVAPDFEIKRTIDGKPVNISLTFEEREQLAKHIGQDFRSAIQPYVENGRIPTEDEMGEIYDIHRKIAKPYEDSAFGTALQKRIAEGKITL